MTGILAFILCCSTTLSWEAVEKDRVDFVDVIRHGDERLEIYIESSRGIGSVSLDFREFIEVDSIRIKLMYDSLNPFRFCESIGLEFVGGGDSDLWMTDHSMIPIGKDGTVSFPADEGFVTLRISWIDFYRQ